MLTGKRAFCADSTAGTLADVIHKEPRPASEIVDGLPNAIEMLLARCLRKDPARRWQSIADVKAAMRDLASESPASPAPLTGKRRLALLWTGVAALVLLSAAAAYFRFHHPPDTTAVTPVPLTSYPGEQIQPSFSPEGNQVAFAWNGRHLDNWDIYVKVVGEGDPLQITSDPASEFAPAWSPDGRWIAFARMRPHDRYELTLISPLGGAEKILGEFGGERGDRLSFFWSSDSKYLLFSIIDDPNRADGIYVISLETGVIHQLTTSDLPSPHDRNPALTPDGRTLAFKRGGSAGSGAIYTIPIEPGWQPKGPPRLLVPIAMGTMVWTPGGAELIYAFGPNNTAVTLRRIAVAGESSPAELPVASTGAFYPAISHPDGRGTSRLAWARYSKDANIYRMAIPASPETVSTSQSWIASSFRDTFPQYSPDGKSIVFYSDRSGTSQIWTCQADGLKCRQIANEISVLNASPRWSPDSKRIVFDCQVDGVFQVYMVNAEGGPAKPLTSSPSSNFSPNWSPDGQWIYFASNRGPTAALDIWKTPARGGMAEQVTHNGGFGPAVSPDGKFLYYAKAQSSDESSLWRAPIGGGDETQVIPRIFRFNYAVTNRGVYYAEPLQSRLPGGTIEFLDTANGRRSVLVRTDKALDLGLGVSPDGRYLLYSQVDYLGSNLMMLDNFH
jgi:Tol biopolymer transport system component